MKYTCRVHIYQGFLSGSVVHATKATLTETLFSILVQITNVGVVLYNFKLYNPFLRAPSRQNRPTEAVKTARVAAWKHKLENMVLWHKHEPKKHWVFAFELQTRHDVFGAAHRSRCTGQVHMSCANSG